MCDPGSEPGTDDCPTRDAGAATSQRPGSLPYLDGEVARLVGAADLDARLAEQSERGRVRMPVVVPGADTDQADARRDGGESRRVQPVRAPVVSDLEHVRVRQSPARGHHVLRARLRVPGEQRREPAAADQQDDARVVDRQRGIRAARPQDPHLGLPQSPRLSRPECPPAVRAACRQRTRLDALGRELRRIRHAWHPYPADRRDADQAGETADVVGVRVGQDDAVELPHPLAPERPAQHVRSRAAVHEHRRTAVRYEDRVALPDIQHDEFRPRGRRSGRRQQQRAGQHQGKPAQSAPRGRLRPYQP
jgi:hypothetical protein